MLLYMPMEMIIVGPNLKLRGYNKEGMFGRGPLKEHFCRCLSKYLQCVTSHVLLAGGHVVFLLDLPFSPHLPNDSAQNE